MARGSVRAWILGSGVCVRGGGPNTVMHFTRVHQQFAPNHNENACCSLRGSPSEFWGKGTLCRWKAQFCCIFFFFPADSLGEQGKRKELGLGKVCFSLQGPAFFWRPAGKAPRGSKLRHSPLALTCCRLTGSQCSITWETVGSCSFMHS